VLVDSPTGQVSALLGGTYLTAARTAAGSAIATDVMTLPSEVPLHLTVFGAGLQAEMHIDAVRSVRRIGNITLVNRSAGRAEELIEKVRQQTRKEEEQEDIEINLVLLADKDGVQQAVSRADIICTTTNTMSPLFDGSWVKPGCHLNAVGSYTAAMEEVEAAFIESRCKVVVDTPEAVDVGDLKLVSDTSENYIGLLGDLLAGNVTLDATATADSVKYDCTMFKSVGTAIQDVITAHEVYKKAIERGIGLQVEM
jgi:ornithine cyclodeaminase